MTNQLNFLIFIKNKNFNLKFLNNNKKYCKLLIVLKMLKEFLIKKLLNWKIKFNS